MVCGSSPPPKFDHWAYYEKFDMLAVFWGMVAIGISGALLWSPSATAKFVPGWVINVARIIHSEEALLAIGFIFNNSLLQYPLCPNQMAHELFHLYR